MFPDSLDRQDGAGPRPGKADSRIRRGSGVLL